MPTSSQSISGRRVREEGGGRTENAPSQFCGCVTITFDPPLVLAKLLHVTSLGCSSYSISIAASVVSARTLTTPNEAEEDEEAMASSKVGSSLFEEVADSMRVTGRVEVAEGLREDEGGGRSRTVASIRKTVVMSCENERKLQPREQARERSLAP
jgi:hypothetical protein